MARSFSRSAALFDLIVELSDPRLLLGRGVKLLLVAEQLVELLGGHGFHPPPPLGERLRDRRAGGRQVSLLGVLGKQSFVVQGPQKIDAVDLAVLIVVLQERQVLQELGVGVAEQARYDQETGRRCAGQPCRDPQPGPQAPPRRLGLGLLGILGGGQGHHLQGGAGEVFAGGR